MLSRQHLEQGAHSLYVRFSCQQQTTETWKEFHASLSVFFGGGGPPKLFTIFQRNFTLGVNTKICLRKSILIRAVYYSLCFIHNSIPISMAQAAVSNRKTPGSLPEQSTWDLWCTKLHWERCFSQHFDSFSASRIPTMPPPPVHPSSMVLILETDSVVK